MFKKNFVLYLILLLIVLNLLFYSGWDIRVQTLTWIISLLLGWLSLWRKTAITKKAFTVYSGLLISGTAVSFIYTYDKYLSHISLFTLFSAAVVFIVSSSHSTEKFKKDFGKYIIFIIFGAALLELLFFKNLFPNPHFKTAFYIMGFPFLMKKATIDTNPKEPRNYIYILILSVFTVSFFIAYSVWGWAVLIFSTLLFLHLEKKIRLDFFRIILLALIGLIFAAVFVKPEHFADRLDWLNSGITAFLKRPLTGFGPGTTPLILPSFSFRDLSLFFHSFFLQFLVEYGIIAFSGILIFFYAVLKETYKGKYSSTAFISLLSVLIYNLFEYNLSIPLINLTFAFISGLYISTDNYELKVKDSTRKIILLFLLIPTLLIGHNMLNPMWCSGYFIEGARALARGKPSEDAKYFFKESSHIIPGYRPGILGLALVDMKEGNLNSAADKMDIISPRFKNSPSRKALEEARTDISRENPQEALNHLFDSAYYHLIKFRIEGEIINDLYLTVADSNIK